MTPGVTEERKSAKEKILDVEPAPGEAEVKASQPLYRRRKCQLCCAIFLVVIFLIGILLIILIFGVFKPKDPSIVVNNVTLADLNITFNPPTAIIPQVKIKLDLSITVHNPNKAKFRYTNSSALLYYHEIEVGHAAIPAGAIGADGTETQVVMLNVQADKFLQGVNFTSDYSAGVMPVSSVTRVTGRVNVLNVYKHHAVSMAWCNMEVFISNATLKSFACSYKVKL